MAAKEADYGREVRETIVKSSLTGVAATVLAVALASPAGLGGFIGTTFASGAGNPNAVDENNPYSLLPAYPVPLSQEEVSEIRAQLARTAAQLDISRAATEAKVEYVRQVALRGDLMMVASVSQTAPAMPAVPAAAPAHVVEAAAPIEAPVLDAAYAAPLHDPHLELAALLLDEGL